MFRKAKVVPLPLREVPAWARALYDRLSGKTREKLHSQDGVILDLPDAKLALLRNVAVDNRYTVALSLGDRLYFIGEAAPYDPQIKALADQMTVFPPSKQEQETKRREKEAANMTHEERFALDVGVFRSWGLEVWAGVEPKGIENRSKDQEPEQNPTKSLLTIES